ncbi:MarR family transcriptional regulator [Selenomonas caprae]|uniref:MarR family transcriptional regulator n=1 Tax=Selenomonas caprae TaxID=2606905 RepID=A0A5D6WLE8_9FIRM|nr:MarR family transcriptional regulator [Selenomonas caprae]MBQ1889727.1 MarR family transcriptional regulator [Selenomonas sp.]TYZ28312.1 MarR family transcriptional regulator [Selenomonas caprae]
MNNLSTPNVSQKFIETLILIHNNFYRQTKLPIPLNQFGALMVIFTEESVSITDISHILNISKQQMTTVIDKLVCNGMVQKAPDPHDRRRSVITLTPAGQKILDDQNERVRQLFNQHIQQLNEDETAQLSDSILTFNQLLEKMFIN